MAPDQVFSLAHWSWEVIHGLDSPRLDYGNSPYSGIGQSSMSCLQMVQTAAAMLMTGTQKRPY